MRKPDRALNVAGNLLGIAVVLSLGYLFYSLYTSREYHFRGKDIDGVGKRSYADWDGGLADEDYSEFLRQAQEREFFTSPYGAKDVSGRDVDKDKIGRLKSSLRLIGVIAGEPNMAIVGERARGKTFYLKPGETFLDNVAVKDVKKDSVVLEYYGEDIELFM